MVTSLGPSFADIVAAYCLQNVRRDPTETQNQSSGYSCGKRVKFTSSLGGFWDSSFQDLQAEERELCVGKSLRPIDQRFKQQSNERTRGWSSSRCRKQWDYSLGSTELWPRYTSLWRGGRSSAAREGTWAEQNRNCVAPTCQMCAHECSRPYGRAARTP